MTELQPTLADPLLPCLSAEALQKRADRLLRGSTAPRGWTPKTGLDDLVTDALHLAALVEQTDSPLCTSEMAGELRALSLACRALSDETERVRADRSEVSARRALKDEAMDWLGRASAGLRFVAPRVPDKDLMKKLRNETSQERSAHALAYAMELHAYFCHHYQAFVGELGLDDAFVTRGYTLADAVRCAGYASREERSDRKAQTERRNRLLFVLYERNKSARALLRFIHRSDRAWLARIARPRRERPATESSARDEAR